jgi:nucleotide-binding universal stress UspA family protein
MSYPFKKILCPVQFEDSEQVALTLASQMARDMSATVYLLHVVLNMQAVDAPEIAVAVEKSAEDDARLKLQAIAEKVAGLKFEIVTRVAGPGDTSKAVLEVATDLDADLIVLKTHGRRGLAHFVMGSVAEQVVRRAHCAVLTLTSTAGQRHLGPMRTQLASKD